MVYLLCLLMEEQLSGESSSFIVYIHSSMPTSVNLSNNFLAQQPDTAVLTIWFPLMGSIPFFNTFRNCPRVCIISQSPCQGIVSCILAGCSQTSKLNSIQSYAPASLNMHPQILAPHLLLIFCCTYCLCFAAPLEKGHSLSLWDLKHLQLNYHDPLLVIGLLARREGGQKFSGALIISQDKILCAIFRKGEFSSFLEKVGHFWRESSEESRSSEFEGAFNQITPRMRF